MYEKRSINLCSIYMLPLLGLNQSSFGIGNFINSHISEDDKNLVVVLKESPTSIIRALPSFKFSFEKEGLSYSIFEVPEQFVGTIGMFRKGRYSEFSAAAKDMIRKKSGLRYKVATSEGKVRTARELLALDKDKDLRKIMEDELAVKIPKEAELASIPGEDNFLELNLSTELIH